MTMNMSFAGCGFLGIYHVGVVSCFKHYAPNLIDKLLGASAGAISACCLLCECPLGQVTSDALKIATTARNYSLGPFNPKFDVTRILQDRLDQILPTDAHVRCSGRLHISCTRVADGKNIVLTEFETKQELIQALLCSSFIPIFSGIIPPTYRGVRYIDGCYSDNLPILDENTITVSPFCGECDICPRDDSYNLLQVNLANTSIELSSQNFYRFMRVLFPPHPEILSQMCKQGFDDALHFLRRNDLISCTRCTAVQSSNNGVKVSEQVAEQCQPVKGDGSSEILIENPPKDSVVEICVECVQKKQKALLDDLPEVVIKVLEEACDSMNRGIINWVFKHKSMRLLSVLTLPYVLPLDFAYVVFAKFLQLAPKLSRNLLNLAEGIINYIRNVFKRVSKSRHLLSAKFSCQLAITGFDFEADDGYKATPDCQKSFQATVAPEAPPPPPSRKISAVDKAMNLAMNFDVSVNVEAVQPSATSPLVSLDSLLSRWPAGIDELLESDTVTADDEQETFDRILDVIHQQEALVASYYLREANDQTSTAIPDWETPTSKVCDVRDVSRDSALDSLRAGDDRPATDLSFCEVIATDLTNYSLGDEENDDGYLLDHVVVVDSSAPEPKRSSFILIGE